jgi:phosphate transport system substrate-binding protein
MVAVLAVASFGVAAHAQTQIAGAGSCFAQPICQKWGLASAAATGIQLNYQAVGSGTGVNQINDRTVDFGASDMPLSADKTSHR